MRILANIKNLYFLLLPFLILVFGCSDTNEPENPNCLTGVIIGNGCTAEGYLIEVTDLRGKVIEIGTVTMASKTYFNVMMTFPGTPDWQIGDKIYFEISEIPAEKNYICQDLYAAAPLYNLIRISKNKCL